MRKKRVDLGTIRGGYPRDVRHDVISFFKDLPIIEYTPILNGQPAH